VKEAACEERLVCVVIDGLITGRRLELETCPDCCPPVSHLSGAIFIMLFREKLKFRKNSGT